MVFLFQNEKHCDLLALPQSQPLFTLQQSTHRELSKKEKEAHMAKRVIESKTVRYV